MKRVISVLKKYGVNSNFLRQALDDFGMIKEGDRVLVCLSGSSSSLCLLHLLRQFVRARHLTNVTLATVSFGDCGVDPRALMLYLRELRVDYFYEQTGLWLG